MKPNTADCIQNLDKERELTVSLGRRYRRELRCLRGLKEPHLSVGTWSNTLQISYHIKVLSMKETERYLQKFSTIFPLESITSSDSADGCRIFTAGETRYDRPFNLILQLHAHPREEDNLRANCRRVPCGTDTHTYTSTKYKIICDEGN